MEIKIPKQYLSVDIPSLNDYLDSRHQNKLNTESLRQEIMQDIENWSMLSVDMWTWERDESYRKMHQKEIEKTQIEYYEYLINQTKMDDKTKKDMIWKYGTGRTESEWLQFAKNSKWGD